MNATRPAKQLRLADAVTEGKETELIKSLQADLRLAYRERDDWMNKCKALHTTKIIEAVIEFASKALGVALSNYREVELTEMTATACLLGVLLGRYATLSGTTVALVQVDGDRMQELLTTAAPKDTRSLN